ncbi:hypothetical protein KBD59_02730 [Candidatus Gracilibacteria bacterium]|nr:hypothetical protein [Candidatus Gracilibacteria bacterium]
MSETPEQIKLAKVSYPEMLDAIARFFTVPEGSAMQVVERMRAITRPARGKLGPVTDHWDTLESDAQFDVESVDDYVVMKIIFPDNPGSLWHYKITSGGMGTAGGIRVPLLNFEKFMARKSVPSGKQTTGFTASVNRGMDGYTDEK